MQHLPQALEILGAISNCIRDKSEYFWSLKRLVSGCITFELDIALNTAVEPHPDQSLEIEQAFLFINILYGKGAQAVCTSVQRGVLFLYSVLIYSFP